MALPGVNTIYKDRFYVVSRNEIPRGPKVLIIGRRTTANGTVDSQGRAIYDLDPYDVLGEQEAGIVFGAQSDVVRGYIEAVAGGASRVSVVALPADTVFNHNTATLTSSSYTSGGGLDLWADLWAAVEAAEPSIVVPWGRGSSSSDWDDNATPATPGTSEFGFYANNSAVADNSWAFKIATEMSNITLNSSPAFAVMGIKPFVGQTDVTGAITPASVAAHIGGNITNLVNRDSATMGIVGSYVNIVGTELKPLGYEDTYAWGWSNGAAHYAGAITQLEADSSTTMKRIFNVGVLRYAPTKLQQLNLIEKGIVPVALNFQREAIWVDGLTFSNTASQYTRLSTVRIINDAVQLVRAISQQFIGEASTIEMRNAFDTAITSVLMGMQKQGTILASDFTITYFPQSSKAVVDLSLTPAFELRNIEVQVSINL
jgi:hypothetical protein